MEIETQKGDAVKAMFAGTVRLSKNNPPYGNVIVIRHDNGLETVYGNNAQNLVKSGDKVKAGQTIAIAGSSDSRTYTLFAMMVNGSRINPWHALFTHREIDVLRLMCRNLEREEIAREMSVSVGTVKNVISVLLVKTGFKNIHRLLTHLLASGVLVSAGESAPQDER